MEVLRGFAHAKENMSLEEEQSLCVLLNADVFTLKRELVTVFGLVFFLSSNRPTR